jgi:hypothetical protein
VAFYGLHDVVNLLVTSYIRLVHSTRAPRSPTTSDVLLYQSPDGQIQLHVQLDHDTMWLTQAQMSELFDFSKKTSSEPIGKTYRINYYNLDVIIAVGYRVKSKRGTSFRQ